jgi:MOSC domain-containing protein YiiM
MMKIVSINVSKHKGTQKKAITQANVIKDHGLEGDAHAGPWHRQVSFLASESIETARNTGLDVDSGDFAENITTAGIDWKQVPVGARLKLGDHVIVEITQIGKECHNKCAIYYKAGDCIMPREGIFGRVIGGGPIRIGDPIRILDAQNSGNTNPVR